MILTPELIEAAVAISYAQETAKQPFVGRTPDMAFAFGFAAGVQWCLARVREENTEALRKLSEQFE